MMGRRIDEGERGGQAAPQAPSSPSTGPSADLSRQLYKEMDMARNSALAARAEVDALQ